MNLFEKKKWIMHSGDISDFKIECDALTDKDIETLAYLISKRFTFYGIYGIPTGGLRLAKALNKYKQKDGFYFLIVDDVMTSGESMKEAGQKEGWRDNVVGVVIFGRNMFNVPRWIYSMFDMQPWLNLR